MGVTAFDEATAATPDGPGRYAVLPDARFATAPTADGVQPAVNGGVLLASMLRGVLAESPHPYPLATSAHFLRVPRIAPAQVRVGWLKQGRTAAVARVVLSQDDVALIDATVTTGSLPEEAGDGLCWTGEPPVLPPPEECVPLRQGGGISGQLDMRLDPATAGWLRRQPAGLPEMRGYFRLLDDRDPDAYLLAFAVDSLPPTVFGLGAIGWAPTVELTWHMRAVPAPGPLRVSARCRHVSGGWFDEESEVWDDAGRLVAQSRQLALVGRLAASGPRHPFAAASG